VEAGNGRALFVSHVHEDREVAAWLQSELDEAFIGEVDVFVSSERQHAGQKWLERIEDELRRCKVLVALCSPLSIERPWVNFELGAGWMLDKCIVPACHGGLTPDDLKRPLSDLLAVTLSEPDGLRTLFTTLQENFGFRGMAPRDYEQLAEEVPRSEPAAPPGADQMNGDPDSAIRRRLWRGMERSYKFRTIGALATEAATDEDTVLRILREADDEVRFSKGKSGRQIAGLISRVGS
jgi:hypothetical protein